VSCCEINTTGVFLPPWRISPFTSSLIFYLKHCL
jgi:hypothetical protein